MMAILFGFCILFSLIWIVALVCCTDHNKAWTSADLQFMSILTVLVTVLWTVFYYNHN
jgi:hypothetical protein